MASSSDSPVRRSIRIHRRRLWAVLGISLVACSCSLVMQSGIPPTERKIVIAKEAPNRLIAQDETQCTVPEARFESVLVGDAVSCVWFEAL